MDYKKKYLKYKFKYLNLKKQFGGLIINVEGLVQSISTRKGEIRIIDNTKKIYILYRTINKDEFDFVTNNGIVVVFDYNEDNQTFSNFKQSIKGQVTAIDDTSFTITYKNKSYILKKEEYTEEYKLVTKEGVNMYFKCYRLPPAGNDRYYNFEKDEEYTRIKLAERSSTFTTQSPELTDEYLSQLWRTSHAPRPPASQPPAS